MHQRIAKHFNPGKVGDELSRLCVEWFIDPENMGIADREYYGFFECLGLFNQ